MKKYFSYSIFILLFALICILGLTTNVKAESTIFEDVGHYAFATAGNNLAYKGDRMDHDFSLIENYPSNWDTIKANIPSDILNRVNNMSGSYLNYDGTAKLGLLSTAIIRNQPSEPTDFDALIIYPDGDYKVYNSIYNKNVEIEIKGSGWYYVSILNLTLSPQQAWGITVIYENNETLSNNYTKLINVDKSIMDTASTSVLLNSKLNIEKNINIYGMITYAGVSAWPREGYTEDRAWAILEDDSLYQLYDRGDGHFTGRTNTDFANGTYTAQRSHNIPGGELDIFEEKLTTDYFGGKKIKGLKFQKDGKDVIRINLVGFSVEVEMPDLFIETKITSEEKFKKGDNAKITTTVKNLKLHDKNVKSYHNKISSSVDEALSNVKDIKVYLNGNLSELRATYDENTRLVNIEEIETLNSNDIITLEYNATINDKIEQTVNNNLYNLNTIAKVDFSGINLNGINTEELGFLTYLQKSKESRDNLTAPRRFKLKVNHYIENTEESLADSTESLLPVGDHYVTRKKDIYGYSLVETPSNAEGEITKNTEVTYFYRLKDAKVIVKYIDQDSGEELDDEVTINGKVGKDYEATEKDFPGYRLISKPVNEKGKMKEEDTEVIYYYTRKDAAVIANYVDVNGEQIAPSEPHSGKVGDKYVTVEKNIDDYILTKVPENKEGLMSEETTIVTYVYDLKPAKVIVKYVDKDGKPLIDDEQIKGKLRDTYKTEVKGITNYELIEEPNNKEGKIDKEIVTVTYVYDLKPAKVIVKYVDKDGKPIANTEEKNGKIGDAYTTDAKVINGYELVEIPANNNGTMKEEINTVTYIYKVKEAKPPIIPQAGENESIKILIGAIALIGIFFIVKYFKMKDVK